MADETSSQQVSDEMTPLDEAEEKLAYLLAGCAKMSRDELIQKITEVGSARWKSGIWLAERTAAAFDHGVKSVERPNRFDSNHIAAVEKRWNDYLRGSITGAAQSSNWAGLPEGTYLGNQYRDGKGIVSAADVASMLKIADVL